MSFGGGSSDNLVDRYIIRQAVRQVCASATFRNRTASLQDMTPEVLTAFAEGFYLPMHQGRVAFGGVVKKLSQIADLFKKIPKMWDAIKDFLGIKGLMDIPRAIKDWASKGLGALKHAFRSLYDHFPTTLIFFPKGSIPSLTNLVHRIMTRFPGIAKILAGIKGGSLRIDRFLEVHPVIKAMSRPILAAAFIYIWINVGELTWDIHSILEGFLGRISLGSLLAMLPEAALGLLIAKHFLPGAKLGPVWFGSFPIALLARIIWLEVNYYLEWVPGKGFKVNWDKMRGNEGGAKSEFPAKTELVSVF